MFSLEESDEGAIIVMIDILYMWSAIDSPSFMPKRFHPSRFSRFKPSTRWKKGIGEVEFSCGGFGNSARTAKTKSVDDLLILKIHYQLELTTDWVLGERRCEALFCGKLWSRVSLAFDPYHIEGLDWNTFSPSIARSRGHGATTQLKRMFRCAEMSKKLKKGTHLKLVFMKKATDYSSHVNSAEKQTGQTLR